MFDQQVGQIMWIKLPVDNIERGTPMVATFFDIGTCFDQQLLNILQLMTAVSYSPRGVCIQIVSRCFGQCVGPVSKDSAVDSRHAYSAAS